MDTLAELLRLFADPDCAEHGSKTAYDCHFGCLRCCWCGHRVGLDGQPVTATRHLPFWRWPKEVSGRAWAKQTRNGTRKRLMSQ